MNAMAEGKWIEGLTATMPVSAAAHKVLSIRLAVVRHYLPLAAERPEDDIEHVHQLRVSTRRAGAALRVFRDVLPNRPRRRVRRLLRRLRRAAGQARDWDVFLLNLPQARALQTAASRPAADFLLGYGLGQRHAAQLLLVQAAEQEGADLNTAADELLEALEQPRDNDDPPLRSFALEQFHPLFTDFHQGVLADPAQPAELHQLRISGKRLRYALEIFIPCFPEWFQQQLYPAVEELQELLGTLQDAVVGSERLKDLAAHLRRHFPHYWPRLRPGLDGRIRSLRAQIPALRKAFQKWRSRWLDLAEQVHEVLPALTASAARS
jgi:CHAD domain-containing protein